MGIIIRRKAGAKARPGNAQPKTYPWKTTVIVILLINLTTCMHLNKKGEYEMITSEPLKFFTGHVQGIAFSKNYLFLSAVDKEEKTGYLFKIDPVNFSLLDQLKLKVGNIYHPGGISFSDGYVYLPLAEYKADSTAVIFMIDPKTMKPAHSFTVKDHIGAVTADGKEFIFGMNWDARDVYIWNIRGTQLAIFKNPRNIAYQDIEYKNNRLYCSGIKKSLRQEGVIDIYDFDSSKLAISLYKTLSVPQLKITQSIANEGMTIKDGYFYFVPEDFPKTKLYRLKINE